MDRNGKFKWELKVYGALGRTCNKAPGREGGELPKDWQSTTSKCPGLVPRVRAKDVLVSESTKGLMVECSSQHPSSHKMEAEGD